MTEEYPDDVEAWIELAGILEQSDVQVHQPYLYVIDLVGVGRPNPLPFLIPFLTEHVSLSHTFY